MKTEKFYRKFKTRVLRRFKELRNVFLLTELLRRLSARFMNSQVVLALRGQNNELFGLNFDVREGHSGSHRLDGAVTLPNGFLYHKFTFDDGSYKTYTTIKQ